MTFGGAGTSTGIGGTNSVLAPQTPDRPGTLGTGTGTGGELAALRTGLICCACAAGSC